MTFILKLSKNILTVWFFINHVEVLKLNPFLSLKTKIVLTTQMQININLIN